MKYKITFNGKTAEYEEGTLFEKAAEDLWPKENGRALLAFDRVHNSTVELCTPMRCDMDIDFLTYQNEFAMEAYANTALLLFEKAFYDTVGHGKEKKFDVIYTFRGNYCIAPKGDFQLDEAFVSAVEKRMRELQAAALPIKRRRMLVNDAAAYFRHVGQEDRAKLLNFRRTSDMKIYELDGVLAYFFSCICPNTSYAEHFSLVLFKQFVILRLPDMKHYPEIIDTEVPPNLYELQTQRYYFSLKVDIFDVADLNERICLDFADGMILTQEAYFEKQIGEIAQDVIRKKKKIVLIAGPSSSGKTTTSHRLSLQIGALGVKPHIISADNYFKPLEHRVYLPNGKPDFESINAVDTELFNADMLKLLAGEEVKLPVYNFRTGLREEGKGFRLGEDEVLIIEGIHCLNERFSEKLPDESKYRIYVSALSHLNLDEHNCVPHADLRLMRRMVRDYRTRGYSAEETISRWHEVLDGEKENIYPYIWNADTVLNTAMIYELAVLKANVEKLLFGIPNTSPQYATARRLLKFTDFVLPISPELIPRTSVVREFIGGSCLDVG